MAYELFADLRRAAEEAIPTPQFKRVCSEGGAQVETLLFDIVREGDDVTLSNVFRAGFKFTEGYDGCVLVNTAVSYKCDKCLNILLERGAKVNNEFTWKEFMQNIKANVFLVRHIQRQVQKDAKGQTAMDAAGETQNLPGIIAALTIEHPINWTSQFIEEWLKTLDLQDEERKAIHAFNANRIRGKDLKDLDKNDLREMGLSYPTSKRIRDAIQLL